MSSTRSNRSSRPNASRSAKVRAPEDASAQARPGQGGSPSFEQRMSVASMTRNNQNRKIGMTESRSRIPLMPFPNALGWSTGLHIFGPPVLVGLFFLIGFLLLWLMNLNIFDWFKSPPKKPDMVFVLTNDRNLAPPKQALVRAEHNQHAGGKKRENEEVRPPEKISPDTQAAQQKAKPETKPTPPKPAVKPQQQQQAKQQPTPPQPKPTPKAPQQKPPMQMPTFKPTIPLASKSQPSPQVARQQAPTGPVAKTTTRTTSQSSPASNPSPVQIASQGALAVSSARSSGNNSRGNPQGGPGEDGVDAMSDENFGSLIADLQRRIKRNWQPPRGMASRRIEVKIVIARDGRVLDRDIVRSAGDPLADNAALRAIDASAPFRAFPPQIREDKVTIQFTFDYNVLNSRANNSY